MHVYMLIVLMCEYVCVERVLLLFTFFEHLHGILFDYCPRE
jgi:hypothetical protein